jgi:signal transduction histidine kinase
MLAALLAAGLLFADQLPGDDGTSVLRSRFESSPARGATNSSRTGVKPAPANNTGNELDSLLRGLISNKEFLIYGGIASFGILMMGLAIGSASSNPKSNTEAQLALLRREKEKAENLARLKSEFLNQVSHELRTPAVIIGYVECITDGLYGQIEPNTKKFSQVVAKQSSHPKNMIDQILIYSRLSGQAAASAVEDLNLTKIIGEMKIHLIFSADKKELTCGGTCLKIRCPSAAISFG